MAKEFQYLASLGYTGTLADKRRAYYDDLILNGGEPDIPITGEYVPRREFWLSSNFPVISQRIQLTYFTAKVTESINTITAYSGAVAAAATPTVCVMGLYSVDSTTEDLTLLASTTNDTSLFSTINTAYPKTLSSTVSKVTGQRYAAAVLVVSGTTLPQFLCHLPNTATGVQTRWADKPRLAGVLTGQSSLPSSILNASVASAAVRFAFYLTT